MALDGVSKLGERIGSLSNKQDTVEQNISPNEDTPIDTVKSSETYTIGGTVKCITKLYPATSFILDHVVYCDLDSSVLELDGGYDEDDGQVLKQILPDDYWSEHQFCVQFTSLAQDGTTYYFFLKNGGNNFDWYAASAKVWGRQFEGVG